MTPDPSEREVVRQGMREVAASADRGRSTETGSKAPPIQPSPLFGRLIITLSAWFAAFLIVLGLVEFFGKQLNSLPVVARALVMSGVVVVAMVNLVEPLLKRLAARFVGPRSREDRRVQRSRRSGLESGSG